MANLSKIKRDKLLSYIEQLKDLHTDDESLILFNELQNALTEKRYGLVFEEHSEEVDERLLREIPVLIADPERRLCKDASLPWNFIIEGDNLQALYLLEKTHKGKIDCIYIDPPYNTGAKDWKYNNRFVVDTDDFRHSKWLSMMEKRLKIAKNLLSPDGAMIIAIDENEQQTLGLLIHELFPSHTIDCIAVIHNPGGIQGANFSYCHEYAYFIYPRRSYYIKKEKRNDNDELTPFRDWGKENSKRQGSPNCFYPIIVDLETNTVVRTGDVPDDDFHPSSANEIRGHEMWVWPIDVKGVERRWRFAYDTVGEIIEELYPVDIRGVINIQRKKKYFTRKTVWSSPSFSANNSGTQLIAKIIGNRFTFPKSLYLVKECLAACLQKKDAIILDFFAGSGTTQHAVNLLNAEDGGTRRCIMVTNNEISAIEENRLKAEGYNKGDPEWEALGIAKYVTYPRTVCSIEGVDVNGNPLRGQYLSTDTNGQVLPMSQGFTCNIKFMKCDWVPRVPEETTLTESLMEHVKEMIELEHAIDIDGKKYLMILSEDEADELEATWHDHPLIQHIYISRNVLLTTNQNKLFNTVELHTIPDYYFDIEMKEVGETW